MSNALNRALTQQAHNANARASRARNLVIRERRESERLRGEVAKRDLELSRRDREIERLTARLLDQYAGRLERPAVGQRLMDDETPDRREHEAGICEQVGHAFETQPDGRRVCSCCGAEVPTIGTKRSVPA